MGTQISALESVRKTAWLRSRKIIKRITDLKIQNKNQDSDFKASLLTMNKHSILNSKYQTRIKWLSTFFFNPQLRNTFCIATWHSHMNTLKHTKLKYKFFETILLLLFWLCYALSLHFFKNTSSDPISQLHNSLIACYTVWETMT